MPRIKKSPLTTTTGIQPILPPEEEFSIKTPLSTSNSKDIVKNEMNTTKVTIDIIPDIPASSPKISKEKFKHLHIKDTCWLENDIYQTIADMTAGKKTAKALIINQALKDYLEKNNLEIEPLRAKRKKG